MRRKVFLLLTIAFLVLATFMPFRPMVIETVQADTDIDTDIWIPVHDPIELAFDGANIWVAGCDPNTGQRPFINQYRANDGQWLRSIPLSEYSVPSDMIIIEAGFYGHKWIWLSSNMNDAVFRIEIPPQKKGSEWVYRADVILELPDSAFGEMAFDGHYVWVTDLLNERLVRINTGGQHNPYKDNLVLPQGSIPTDLAFDGESIWVSDCGANTIMKINPDVEDLDEENAILEVISVADEPGQLVCDGENIWVTHMWSGSLTKIRISDLDMSTVSLPERPCPHELAFDGVNIWVANIGDFIGPDVTPASVMKLSRDGDLLAIFPIALAVGDQPNPLALTFDGSYMWVSWYGGVFKLPASAYSLTLEIHGQCGVGPDDPIRGAEVRVYGHWYEEWYWPPGNAYGYTEWSMLEAVSYTDENGEFLVEVPWAYQKECVPSYHPEGATQIEGPVMAGVHVEVLSRNEAADIRFWDGIDLKETWMDPPPPMDPTLTYRMHIPALPAPLFNILPAVEQALVDGKDTARVELGYAEPEWDEAGAFQILNIISDARDLIIDAGATDLPYPVRPPPVIVAWSKYIGGINQFATSPGMIQLADARDIEAAMHEYFHYLSLIYEFEASPGGEYFRHPGLAWSEGGAFFFMDYGPYMCYGEPMFEHPYGEPFSYDWPGPPSTLGGDHWWVVCNVLTSICFEFGFERIWDVCYNHTWNGLEEGWDGPETIDQFWDEWFEQCPPDQLDMELRRLNYIFHFHGIDKNQPPACTIVFPNGGEWLNNSNYDYWQVEELSDGTWRILIEVEVNDPDSEAYGWEFQYSLAPMPAPDADWQECEFIWAYPSDGWYFWKTPFDSAEKVWVRARAKDSLGTWVDSDADGIVDEVEPVYSDWDISDYPFGIGPGGVLDLSGNIDENGVVQQDLELSSGGQLATLTIPAGTAALDSEGNPLESIEIEVYEDTPPPPDVATYVGLFWDLHPEGATYDPPIQIEVMVDPASLDPGVELDDLVVAYYNEATGEWEALPTIDRFIDPDTGWYVLVAEVNHFTAFGALGGVNQVPVADAGEDSVVERSSTAGATVTLDGSGSFDTDADPLTYLWTWSGGSASGVNPTVVTPMGATAITLEVSDGNLSDTDTVVITVQDTTPPEVVIVVPSEGDAVQDGVTLAATASDLSDVAHLRFYIRYPGGPRGLPIGSPYEDREATYNSANGRWEYLFDSLSLLDGYYVLVVNSEDSYGNDVWTEPRPFSIRNWAVIELLPSTEDNNAGRTMPIKFSVSVCAAVDPFQPFVYNEDLRIEIFPTDDPDEIMQVSTFGDTSTDYRISLDGEQYITNFKTDKEAMMYSVAIYRANFLLTNDPYPGTIDSFQFETVKPGKKAATVVATDWNKP